MRKLDLTRALRIKGVSGQILALKGLGFSWRDARTLPPDPANASIFIDHTDAPLGAIANLTARGAWAASFGDIAFTGGSPAVMESDGIKLNGNILRWNGSHGPLARITVLLDVTLTGDPLASLGDLVNINPVGATLDRVRIAYNATSWRGYVPDNIASNFWPATYGQRVVVGIEADLVAGTSKMIGADGEFETIDSADNVPVTVTRIEIGKACIGKLHQIYIKAEP